MSGNVIAQQHDLHQNLVRGVASTGASISAVSQTQHRKISEVGSRTCPPRNEAGVDDTLGASRPRLPEPF